MAPLLFERLSMFVWNNFSADMLTYNDINHPLTGATRSMPSYLLMQENVAWHGCNALIWQFV